MSGLAYYQRNRDVVVNRAKHYYQNDKERLRKQARDKLNQHHIINQSNSNSIRW